MRHGFTLIVAVMFLLIISTLTMLALGFSMTTMRQTSEIYIREQAELLAQGATEYAVLEIFNFDFNTGASKVAGASGLTVGTGTEANCLTRVLGQYPTANPIFDYRVDIAYFGTIGNCVGQAIATPQTAGTVQLDVYVTSTATASPNPIRFHKRTLQKL